MIRNVNLINHLPPFVQEYREIQYIAHAENPEFQALVDLSETVKNNMFVVRANETGIARYEEMLGLTPTKDDDLESRRARVLSKYTNTSMYTYRGLIERLDAVCGVGNYTVELYPAEYTIKIMLNLRAKNLLGAIKPMIDEMIPANMICVYEITYNTHGDLAQYPHYLLKQFTHQELRDLSIRDNISAACDNLANYVCGDIGTGWLSFENLQTYGMRKV